MMAITTSSSTSVKAVGALVSLSLRIGGPPSRIKKKKTVHAAETAPIRSEKGEKFAGNAGFLLRPAAGPTIAAVVRGNQSLLESAYVIEPPHHQSTQLFRRLCRWRSNRAHKS